jgi:uncharacterized protein YndB with AHSA1/START domain
VERTIGIGAPVDAVWRALTDAEELARWFPTDAEVRPGAGGSIRLRWRDLYDFDSPIEVWEPNEHLRFAFPGDGPGAVVTDYHLEGDERRTILRVVTSGFGHGEDWDEFLDGVRHGWNFELRSLRHYLERHRGEDREVAWARALHGIERGKAWEKLTAPGGFFGERGLGRVVEGSGYDATTSTGVELSGAVEAFEPPRLLVATVDGLNDALLRMELWGAPRAAEVTVWLSTYGIPAAAVRALETSWQRALPAILGA